MNEDQKVVWQTIPLNVLSRGGITQEASDDIVAVLKKHGMFETSDQGGPIVWGETFGEDVLTQQEKEQWMEQLENE